MTQPTPLSCSICALISPVCAPSFAAFMVCAPRRSGVPSASAAHAASTVNGGAINTSTVGVCFANAAISPQSERPEGPP